MSVSTNKSVSASPTVGVIGSGIAGLAAGFLLEQHGYRVTVFEKQAGLGMDAHSIEWLVPDSSLGQHRDSIVRLDVPPRLFNPELWPHLVELYDLAGIQTCPIDPSKSFSDKDGSTYLDLRHGYRPALSQMLSARVRQIAEPAQRLLTLARNWHQDGQWPPGTMAELCEELQFPAAFVQDFLYPALGSTVCTCDFSALDHYPAQILLPALLAMMDGSPLHRTAHGSRDVVDRLSHPLDIRLNTPVIGIIRTAAGTVQVLTEQERFAFSHVIMATQANHVPQLVEDLTEPEQRALKAIPYVQAPVIIHTDSELMPRQKRHWSHFNIFVNKQGSAHRDCQGMSTIWMNRFRDDLPFPTDVFQTIMPFRRPADDQILGQVQLQRPVVTMKSIDAWQQLEMLHRETERRLWFCGSYAARGIPLLESGVASATRIVREGILRQPASITNG